MPRQDVRFPGGGGLLPLSSQPRPGQQLCASHRAVCLYLCIIWIGYGKIAVRGCLMKYRLVFAFSALALAAACNPTPQQQRQLECGIGTVGGAALGAAAGNAFGGGSGRTIMTAAGGAAGAMGGQSVACR